MNSAWVEYLRGPFIACTGAVVCGFATTAGPGIIAGWVLVGFGLVITWADRS